MTQARLQDRRTQVLISGPEFRSRVPKPFPLQLRADASWPGTHTDSLLLEWVAERVRTLPTKTSRECEPCSRF